MFVVLCAIFLYIGPSRRRASYLAIAIKPDSETSALQLTTQLPFTGCKGHSCGVRSAKEEETGKR
jgi:hypothetical protein